MTIVAEQFAHVVGVDTHARTHTFSVLATSTGAVVGTDTFPATGPGMSRAVEWIRRRTATGNVLVAVEGTSSYGARLTRLLEVERFAVCEARPPRRQSRHAQGKSDAIDSVAAARTVLGTATTELISPRAEGLREALRILLAARRSMDTQRTSARNALTALLRTLDLGIDARSPLTAAQVTTVQGWRARQGDGAAAAVARAEARRLASAVITLGAELEDNQRALAEHAELMAPGVLDIRGVGPVTAAIILAAYSHHGRVRSEAAFAALAGASPIPASSGNTTRHRLNRYGDRQLNRTLDVVARTRSLTDPATRAYIERRTAEGRSLREIRRCLKRFIARQIFRQLQTLMA
ncbi:IS110 family transposase [Arthrobacter gyeryongensis]|uniref:IS110 family transposase n=1 Tax=Arthrobacter gyeryongensis TaxID=1650592 RepID=A0ABP9S035_9MICC